MIEVFIHYHSLVDFYNYKPVVARFNFMSQSDVRLLISLKDIKMRSQTEGIIIQKKTFLEKLQFYKKFIK